MSSSVTYSPKFAERKFNSELEQAAQTNELIFDKISQKVMAIFSQLKSTSGTYQIPQMQLVNIIDAAILETNAEMKGGKFPIDFAKVKSIIETHLNKPFSVSSLETSFMECYIPALYLLQNEIQSSFIKEKIDLSEVCAPWDKQGEVDLTKTSCFEYAFARIEDLESFFGDIDPLTLDHDLRARKYQVVEKPQAGDLVLYYQKNDEAGGKLTPTHAGVYQEEGLVESKWGNLSNYVYLHTLEDAPASYGAHVLYFRPPVFAKPPTTGRTS